MPTKSRFGDAFVPRRRFSYNRKPKPMEGTLVVKKPRAPISKPVDRSKVRTMPLPIAADQQPPERVSVAVRGSDGHEFRTHFDPLEPSQPEIDRLLAMDAAIANA